MRDVRIYGQAVVQVLGAVVKDDAVDRELHTLVVGRADVAVLVVVATGSQLVFQDQVFGGVPVEVKSTAESFVEETVVNTEVTRYGGLPFQFRVGSNHFRAGTAVYQHRVEVLRVGSVGSVVFRAQVAEVHIVVTHRTIRQTEFHVRHPVLCGLHPRLIHHTPCGCYGWEVAPLVALRRQESGRCVCTEGSGQVVASLIIIVRACEERQHVVGRVDGVLGRCRLCQTEVFEYLRAAERCVKTVGSGGAEFAFYDVHFLTDHQREVVCVEPLVSILKGVHVAETRGLVFGRDGVAQVGSACVGLTVAVAAVVGRRAVVAVFLNVAGLVAEVYLYGKVFQELILYIPVQGQFVIHLVLVVVVYRGDRVVERSERIVVRVVFVALQQFDGAVSDGVTHTAFRFRAGILCRVRTRSEHLRVAVAGRHADGQALQRLEFCLERQVVTVVVRAVHDTLVVNAVVGQVERSHFVTTRNGDVVVRVQPLVAEGAVLPVCSGAVAPVVEHARQVERVAGSIAVVRVKILAKCRVDRTVLEVVSRLVLQHHIVFGVEHFVLLGELFPSHIARIVHMDLEFVVVIVAARIFGRDDDNAVCTLCTVDSGGSSVFQHVHRGDVARRNIRNARYGESVYDVERVA